MRYSLFESYVRTAPIVVEVADWSDFVADMADLTEHRKANEHTKKKATPSVSPAVYDNGGTRLNANVTGWGGWAALDVDNDLIYTSIEDAQAAMEAMGLSYLIYTSTKAKPNHHRFRLMFPLTRELDAEEAKTAWKALVQYFAPVGPDASCKDISRIYGAPSFFEPAEDGNTDPYSVFEFKIDGNALNIDEVLAAYVPPSEPSWTPRTPAPSEPSESMDAPSFPFPEARKTIPYGSTIYSSPVVRADFVNEYLNLPKGAHHLGLYTFMARVAGRAKAKGFRLDVNELVAYARQLDGISPIKTANERWTRIRTEAERALRFAG